MPPARERSERPTRNALDEDAPQRIGYHFGTPSRPQFEELSQDQQAPEFIQRIAKPRVASCPRAAACTAATAGKKADVPYTADYYFWKKTGA
jgi:hypothetical protein